MTSAIVVHPGFDGHWPFTADRLQELWEAEDDLEFVRVKTTDREVSLVDVISEPAAVDRLVSYGVPVAPRDTKAFTALEEAAVTDTGGHLHDSVSLLKSEGVDIYDPRTTEGYWSESVAEFALGLTIAGLRRIPQLHRQILDDQSPWDYSPASDPPQPEERGVQFGDDHPFTGGPIAKKRVRIVGVGNIGSRYASVTSHLDADVAAYDPYADEPCFHRSGASRVWSISELVADAQIFAPMVPLTESTRGLVDAQHLEALPEGCLVVLATRAGIVDTDALRDRVIDDELALAADVWEGNPGEPIPLDDPLLGRDNVVHTPHIAGRTRHANERFAEMLAEKFRGDTDQR